RRMLAEHGMAAREYKDVRANTVPAFALGDYEWILAFEAPELDRIVDLMRELRATDARRHTREETTIFTGPRVPVERCVNALQCPAIRQIRPAPKRCIATIGSRTACPPRPRGISAVRNRSSNS